MVALLISFLGMLNLIFQTHSVVLRVELVIFAVLLVCSLVMMLGLFVEERWAFNVGMIIFAVVLLNTLYLRYQVSGHPLTFGGVTVFALLGFIIALSSSGTEKMPIIPKAGLKPEVYNINETLETYSSPSKPSNSSPLKAAASPKKNQKRRRRN